MLKHGIKPTLFLDRDGVLNMRIPGAYVGRADYWIPAPGLGEAMALLSATFGRIVVVTNQAGVGKGLMSMADLNAVHAYMLSFVQEAGGRIDRVYACPHRKDEECACRKPATGMALQAQADFPDIEFANSVMVGDSLSDMQFGQALGMRTVLIEGKKEEAKQLAKAAINHRYKTLLDFAINYKTND